MSDFGFLSKHRSWEDLFGMLLGVLIVVSPWFPMQGNHDVMDSERSIMILNTFVVGMLVFMTETKRQEHLRFDWFGFIAMAVGIGSLQLLLDRGEQIGWFGASEAWGEAIVSNIGIGLLTLLAMLLVVVPFAGLMAVIALKAGSIAVALIGAGLTIGLVVTIALG